MENYHTVCLSSISALFAVDHLRQVCSIKENLIQIIRSKFRARLDKKQTKVVAFKIQGCSIFYQMQSK